MTLTFDRITFTVLVHRLSRGQTMYQILEKPKNPRRNSPEASSYAAQLGPTWGACCPLLAELNFSCIRRSLLTPRLVFRHSSPATEKFRPYPPQPPSQNLKAGHVTYVTPLRSSFAFVYCSIRVKYAR